MFYNRCRSEQLIATSWVACEKEIIIFTLPNGTEIPEEEVWIWELYNFKCVLCIYQQAICLHESPPKSKNPKWRKMPETRFPVCNQHHYKLHEMNWKVAQAMLTNQRNAYFPKALEAIETWKTLNSTNM